MSTVLYESKAAYDTWLKIILGFPVVILLVEAYFLARESAEDLLIMAATLAFLGIIYWIILPRRYLIQDDRVIIVLGWPCSIIIHFSTIQSVDKLKGAGVGINFACSSRNAIAIHRKKKLTIHISPVESELFLTNLNKMLQEWRKYYDKSD